MPDDATLATMQFTDLMLLGMKCKLPGNFLVDATSARKGLREFREEHQQGDPEVEEKRSGVLPPLLGRRVTLIRKGFDALQRIIQKRSA